MNNIAKPSVLYSSNKEIHYLLNLEVNIPSISC